MATIAKPESRAEVRLEAFSLALLNWGQAETGQFLIWTTLHWFLASSGMLFRPIYVLQVGQSGYLHLGFSSDRCSRPRSWQPSCCCLCPQAGGCAGKQGFPEWVAVWIVSNVYSSNQNIEFSEQPGARVGSVNKQSLLADFPHETDQADNDPN